MKSNLDDHQKRVQNIAAQVCYFHNAGIPFRMYHGSCNSTRTVIRDPQTSIDVSEMNNILHIDTSRKIASIEPNVPMDKLVKATLSYGFVPPVVPEFPGITAGGAFAGSAGESSSFKYGFWDATVETIQAVLGDGNVVEVSQNGTPEEKELFHSLAGTLGTMGVLTRLDVRLIPSKPYVKLNYHPVHSFEEAKSLTESLMSLASNKEFVDGIMYSPTKGMIISGTMVQRSEEGKVTTFSKRTDEWFYLHVESCFDKSSTVATTEYVPLMDYLFRYDRGAFWMGKYGCAHFSLPFIKLTRVLMDSLFHTRAMFHALHASEMQKHHLIQDMAVPFKKMVPFLDYLDTEFEIYPLWLCPLQYKPMGLEMRHFPADTNTLLNVGIWGPYNKRHSSFDSANRALEKTVKDFQGSKWLYAQSTYTKEEFWQIYNQDAYLRLRRKYNATNLPDVYDKIKPVQKLARPSNIWESIQQFLFGLWLLGGFYGLWVAWLGGDYILRTKPRRHAGIVKS